MYNSNIDQASLYFCFLAPLVRSLRMFWFLQDSAKLRAVVPL